MDQSIELAVQRVIDGTIRGFDPEDPESFTVWNDQLEEVQSVLKDEVAPNPDLLGSVYLERIRIALETGRDALVLKLTDSFLGELPSNDPGFAQVVTARVRSLERSVSLEEAAREAVLHAAGGAIEGSELFYLLASFKGNAHHVLDTDKAAIREKLHEAMVKLRTQGYDPLSVEWLDHYSIWEVAGMAAEVIRGINLEKGQRLLEGS